MSLHSQILIKKGEISDKIAHIQRKNLKYKIFILKTVLEKFWMHVAKIHHSWQMYQLETLELTVFLPLFKLKTLICSKSLKFLSTFLFKIDRLEFRVLQISDELLICVDVTFTGLT